MIEVETFRDELRQAGRYQMQIHRVVDRLALIVAVTLSVVFFALSEPAIAVVALALWPTTKALISVLDVFFLFFTQKPLVRGPAYDTNCSDARSFRADR